MIGADIAKAEPWHRGASGNDLRAAVLGANDGLVSNLCLVMGVAGAGQASHAILLTGLAGLVAGAVSMALGEWLSVTNAREFARSQIDQERSECVGCTALPNSLFTVLGLHKKLRKAFCFRLLRVSLFAQSSCELRISSSLDRITEHVDGCREHDRAFAALRLDH